MVVGVVFGQIVGVIIKKTSSETNLITTLFFRFVFSVPLLLAFAILARGKHALYINQKKTMVLRIACGVSGMIFWILALRHLSFGQATALFQSSVIFVTLHSPILLNESVGWYRWLAVLFGLLGIIILTDPFSSPVSFEIIYGVLAALSGAILAITLRRLGKGDNAISVALIYNLSAACIMMIIVSVNPNLLDFTSRSVMRDLILLGLISSFSQIFFTGAYHYVDAVIVSSLRYLQVPLAGITAFLLFAELMNFYEILGACIVIFSCLIIGWRELERDKKVIENS